MKCSPICTNGKMSVSSALSMMDVIRKECKAHLYLLRGTPSEKKQMKIHSNDIGFH